MNNVTDLAGRRLLRQAHTSGLVRCMECKHELVAVRPAPPEPWWMECPSCGLEKGRPVGPFEKEGRAHWVCNCGNDLFHLTPEGCYCPHCGVWFEPEE